jgi:hypothetical protein
MNLKRLAAFLFYPFGIPKELSGCFGADEIGFKSIFATMAERFYSF